MAKDIDRSEFKLKFQGEAAEINASTLVSSLSGIISILEESNKKLLPKRKIKIKVQSPKRGSFLINMAVESPSIIQTILEHATIQNAAYLVTTLVGILTIRKYFSKEKAEVTEKDENNYQLKSKSGNNIVIDKRIYNIYKDNIQINNAVDRVFGELSIDPAVEEIDILDKNNTELFSATKEHFPEISAEVEEITEKQRSQTISASVNVFKIVWDEHYKWEFFWRGNKISAKILDDNFFKRVHSGEKFAEGDILEVKLKIEQTFNESANTWVNGSYEIVEVINHIPRPEQGKLNL
ncbi:MAG: hypothetical protein HZB59_06765 [Ignavibacteriales bacterium]|nr:hypothetical protein [Ignavibacteriales bacterium]